NARGQRQRVLQGAHAARAQIRAADDLDGEWDVVRRLWRPRGDDFDGGDGDRRLLRWSLSEGGRRARGTADRDRDDASQKHLSSQHRDVSSRIGDLRIRERTPGEGPKRTRADGSTAL